MQFLRGFNDWNQEINHATVVLIVLIIVVLILYFVQTKLPVGTSLESTQSSFVIMYLYIQSILMLFFDIETCIKWCTEKTLDFCFNWLYVFSWALQRIEGKACESFLKIREWWNIFHEKQFRKQTFNVPSQVVAVRFYLIYKKHFSVVFFFFILKPV